MLRINPRVGQLQAMLLPVSERLKLAPNPGECCPGIYIPDIPKITATSGGWEHNSLPL
jgi:hypothetical protein